MTDKTKMLWNIGYIQVDAAWKGFPHKVQDTDANVLMSETTLKLG